MNLGAKVGVGVQRYVRHEERIAAELRMTAHAGFVGTVLSGDDKTVRILCLDHIAGLLEARTGRGDGAGYGARIGVVEDRHRSGRAFIGRLGFRRSAAGE
jgi:hypothetical protein